MKRILVMLCAVALVFNADAQTECLNSQDANQDGLIGVEDLMDLLSHWGDSDLDFDGVYDSVDLCTDEEACNYVLNPTEPCEYLDALGVCGGGCPLDLDGDGVCDEVFGACEGLESFTFDGYAYDLVAIGDQCWFAENLRTEHYANGDAIAGELTNAEWSNTSSGAQAVYNNNDVNLETFGRLYNWYAVDDERGLCPTGWHVPTDGECGELTDFLGGLSIAGTQMKSSPSDDPSWDGTNSSGFSALAGGYRIYYGGFWNGGSSGYFWSSSPLWSGGWYRRLDSGNAEVFRGAWDKRHGFSVRCVRD